MHIEIVTMGSNKRTLGKASFRFVITLILGFLIPFLVIEVVLAPFDASTAFDPSLLFPSPPEYSAD